MRLGDTHLSWGMAGTRRCEVMRSARRVREATSERRILFGSEDEEE